MRTKHLFPHLKSLHIEHITIGPEGVTFRVAVQRRSARCPLCHRRSRRVHSRYHRTLADLPISGQRVVLTVRVRRFRCLAPKCPRQIFAERFPDLAAPFARRSLPLQHALEQGGFALGGEAGARLARGLGMPTSPDTLLRLIRAAPVPHPGMPRVIGVDDWSYKRGLRYGSIVCDLERHRVIDLLPERSADSVAAWLQAHPSIEVAARDRSGLYADGIARGAPQAIQVADRWHLIDNLAETLEKFLLHKGALLKQAAAACIATVVAPGEAQTSPPVDDAMYQGKRRNLAPHLWEQRAEAESARRLALRHAKYEAVCDLHAKGATVMDIARTVGVTRRTVYSYLNDGPPQRRRPTAHGRRRVLAPWEPYLLKRWEEGCHTATRLWREIRDQGFAYSVANVQRFCAQLRRQGGTSRQLPRSRSPFTSVRGPTARRVASLFVQRPEEYTDEQAAYLAQLCQSDATIATALRLTQEFLCMVRERQGERLDAWIETAVGSEIAEMRRFAVGLRDDYAAVRAGLTRAESNGQTEGQINKLKLVKRAMYGRGKFDLLRQRVLHAA
ncbi:MAG: ISL3 family transposase [Chloroflexota bacterium]|nr:ISL3 family transposase [Chloroflexota bacterium]